jgi:hypothetical protein
MKQRIYAVLLNNGKWIVVQGVDKENATVVQQITWTYEGIIAGGKTYKTDQIKSVLTQIKEQENV